ALGAGDVLTCPLVLAPMTGEPPLRIIVAVARQAALLEGAQYLLGLLGVLAAAQQVWALALLALPTALVYLSFRAIAQAEDAQYVAEDRKQMAERRALHDALTGLPNRTLLFEHAEQAMHAAQQGRQ